jgi:hypothetical protein
MDNFDNFDLDLENIIPATIIRAVQGIHTPILASLTKTIFKNYYKMVA